MGKPKSVKPVNLDTNYNWGSFGAADKSGINLNPVSTATVSSVQSGIGQYLNELLDPSYDSEVFKARQSLLDAASNQYAKNLSANAMTRNARGSGTNAALIAAMTNRNSRLYDAMSEEDTRIRNILNSLSGIESNYFNQANTMANNILQRQLTNAERANLANATNVGNYNAWKNNLLSGGAQLGGTILGAYLNRNTSDSPKITYQGAVTDDGMYGAYSPYDI